MSSRPKTNFGPVVVGEAPVVVGTISTRAALESAPEFPCDVVEVRLDKIGAAPYWLESCEAIEHKGKPVLLTIRSAREGGAWSGSEEELRRLLLAALHRLAAVDIELANPLAPEIAGEAARLGKGCVLSHHDFARTPTEAEMESIIARAEALGGVTKIAAMVKSEEDASRLRKLLDGPRRQPLCVIGMGSPWASLRVELARLGSCLAYGYIDDSAAPGQLAAAELAKLLRADAGARAPSALRLAMGELAQQQCVACKGGTPPLKGADIARLQSQLDSAWKVANEHQLEREFKFPDFRQALAFTNKVGELAEQQNHHPDFYLGWGKVKLTLWTHKIDGLTESDFVFAAKVDKLAR